MNTMNTEDRIAEAKQKTEAATARLLATFAHVPEDKLRWSPSSTARTALQIVAHCGASNRAFAAILRGEPLPLPASLEEAMVVIRAGGKDVATREEAVKLVEDSTAEIMTALDTVTADRIETTPQSPFGPMPFAVWMTIPPDHMGGHSRQIDYLQTVWGDIDDHA